MGAGERTPVRVRLNAAPASVPAHWMMCHARPALAFPAEPSESSSAYSTVVERVDGSPAPGQWCVPPSPLYTELG